MFFHGTLFFEWALLKKKDPNVNNPSGLINAMSLFSGKKVNFSVKLVIMVVMMLFFYLLCHLFVYLFESACF
jgi:hypothetical protein